MRTYDLNIKASMNYTYHSNLIIYTNVLLQTKLYQLLNIKEGGKYKWSKKGLTEKLNYLKKNI